MTEPLRVLAVCTGNISRSPAAEHLLRAGLGESAVVGSAGVRAVVGAPVDPPVAAYLADAGVSVDGFAARQLVPALVTEADLVLAMTRDHRSQIVGLVPSAVRRTFTLREFALVLQSLDGPAEGDTPGERLRSLLPRAAAGRAMLPRRPAGDDDVRDPYGHGTAAYARALSEIDAAVATILARLG